MSEKPSKAKRREAGAQWDPTKIRALREYMNMTQQELADELEVRQQTISEWETGLYTPRRSTQKYLSMVAERAGFQYGVESAEQPEADPVPVISEQQAEP